MAKRKQQKKTTYREDVEVLEIDGVGWVVASGDASKPLTEREAITIAAAYKAVHELGVRF
jgi:hypothetical protein